MDDSGTLAISETAEEILAVVRSDFKAAKMRRPFAWDLTELKARIERVLWRRWRRPNPSDRVKKSRGKAGAKAYTAEKGR
jgi:hypothetical protein